MDELEHFMCDLAESTGTAPLARDYFKTYNAASRVSQVEFLSRRLCTFLTESKTLCISLMMSSLLTK